MADNRTSIVIIAQDQASATLGKVGSSLERLSGSAAGLGALKTALGGLAGAFSAGALIGFAKSTIDAADNINDLSQKIGIGVRDLATWQLAAEQSGTSLESVARGVKGLAKHMVENGAAFKAAGITATDVNGAMVQLADIFAAMPAGIEKTTLAVTMFDKVGMDMIPLLNQGSAGLAATQAKAAAYAEKLAELAPKADAFNDSLAEFGLVGKSVAIDALLPMMNALTGILKLVQEATSGISGLSSALGKVADMVNLPQVRALAMLAGGAASLSGGGNVKPGRDLISPEMQARMGTGGMALPGANSEAERAAMARGASLQAALGGKSAGGRSSRSAAGGRTKISDEEKAWGEASQQQAEAFAKTLADEARETERMAKANERLVEQYRQVADPLRKYFQQLDEIRALQGISESEREDFSRKVIEDMDAEVAKMSELGDVMEENNDFAREFGLTFASAFEDAVVNGKSFSEVLKGIEQDILRIVMRKTLTEPLGNMLNEFVGGFDLGSLFGGGSTSGFGDLAGLAAGVPQYAQGTNYVPDDGFAYLHKGEAVVPAGMNATGGGAGITVHNNFTVSGAVDQRTQAQIAAEAGAAIERAMRRNR